MDLVRELKEVRFELSLRGYDCEAVDAFLAKLRGDVASVQQENDAANERIATLESQVQDGGGSSETEGTLRRTLVLAQRLADETEVEAKKAAADLIDTATAEANELRLLAEIDAKSMRDTGESELKAARDDAASVRESSDEDAAKARAQSRLEVAGILEEAETRGAERVVVIEQAAQQEAAAMRDPIRSEVGELEEVRGRLLSDIAELETHLEAQRVRVKTAVEALRVGMSGSIQDLERVAEDDELLATQPAPEHSNASGADVAVAPSIEIVDRVDEAVPEAPTVDEVESAAITKITPSAVEAEAVEDSPIEESSDAGAPADDLDLGPKTERLPVIEEPGIEEPAAIEVEDSVTVEDDGSTLAVPAATADELDEAELVDFDDEPSGMFETEVGEDAETQSAADLSAPVTAAAGAAVVGGSAVAASELTDDAEDIDLVDDIETEPQQSASGGFVERFAESLDTLPIAQG